MAERHVAVAAFGRDRTGLIADLSGLVTELGGNIVHVEQSSVFGMVSVFMLVEVLGRGAATATDPVSARMRAGASWTSGEAVYRFAYDLAHRTQAMGLSVHADVVDPAALQRERDLRVVTILGSDKPGVMHAITGALAKRGVNIERMRHVARGEFMAFEMTVDVKGKDVEAVRQDLRATCERIGVDAVIQPETMFRGRKRLVVFDMDSTIIEGEVINELAKAAGVEAKVALLTERAMRGEIDFEAALRERVRMLQGLPVTVLEQVAAGLRLTPGTEDLIQALKAMGFKIALLSGGFTFFTDRLKATLGFDHTFANELVVRDGVLTGEVKGRIVDADRKGEIVQEIARAEGLTKDEIVAIGDGANDRIMIKNAGLGIAFNAKEVLKQVADGSMSKENLQGLLYALGATDTELKKLKGRGRGS